MLSLVIATIGHAAWDNILRWMILNDPDASILHMHWVRLFFISIILTLTPRTLSKQQFSNWWWLKFATTGWTLPAFSYTGCVLLTDYRIAISFQPFIPLLVAIRVGSSLSGRRLVALHFALLGALTIWLIAPWSHNEYELWQIWGSVLCGSVQVLSLGYWFSVLPKENTLDIITKGVQLSVLTIFVTLIVWSPQHLAASYMLQWDKWLFVILAAGLTSACKNWVVAQCSQTMSADSVAIYECLHPIATLLVDIFVEGGIFEMDDVLAIVFLAVGWILYPK